MCAAELYDIKPSEEIKGLITMEFMLGNYGSERFGWTCRNIKPLKELLPVKGRQGLWALIAEEERAVMERVAA